jgi:glutamate synthase domain-containing protein 3
VAVLGPAGRNFAAGMSGGIAFVYDADGTFKSRCNMGMVDLKPMHIEGIPELRSMIEKHVQYTDSEVGKRILDSWQVELYKFVRVMPRDYARVLKDKHSAA